MLPIRREVLSKRGRGWQGESGSTFVNQLLGPANNCSAERK